MSYQDVNLRSSKLAYLLFTAFSKGGIHGKNDMPEDILPHGIARGSLDHLFFITLTVSIDYQRDANILWTNSRLSFEDIETKYLFNPKQLVTTDLIKIIKDMQKYGLSKKPRRDAIIWRTVGVTFFKKWENDPINFLESCKWDAVIILERLKIDRHLDDGIFDSDFPNLRGDKIGPLWVRMLRDNIGVTNLVNLDKVPIPVDIHIARATLCTGIVRGKFNGRLELIYEKIRKAWFESVKGLNTGSRPMIALDVDEPLWHLSKYGCSKHRFKDSGYCSVFDICEAKDFCVKGIVNIEKNLVELDT